MFSPKDPRETVLLTFDFSGVAATVSFPIVSIFLSSGADTNPADMLLGTPVVSDNNKVTQRVPAPVPTRNCIATTAARRGRRADRATCRT